MVERYRKGYDVVYGRRSKRQVESVLKRLTAWLFYRLMRLLVYKALPVVAADFRLLSKPCPNALRRRCQPHRVRPRMLTRFGLPHTYAEYDREPRRSGLAR